MSTVSLDLDFDTLKNAISKLSKDQKEELLFELNPDLGHALQEMERKALEEEANGDTIPLHEET